MIDRITDLVNKVQTNFDNDPFMTFITLNRSLQYKPRRDSDRNLKYGSVKPCNQNKKRDLSNILYLRTPDSCASISEPEPVKTEVKKGGIMPPLSWA